MPTWRTIANQSLHNGPFLTAIGRQAPNGTQLIANNQQPSEFHRARARSPRQIRDDVRTAPFTTR